MKTRLELRTGPDDTGRRLDRILRLALPQLALSALHRLFRKGRIRVDGVRAAPDTRVPEGALLTIDLDAPASPLPCPPDPTAPPAANSRILGGLEVLRTPDLLFLDKPAGLVVHGGAVSLGSMVLAAFPGSGAGSLSFTPGPLHRLDRNTSGLIAFSMSLRGARNFSAALRDGLVEKTYIAVLEGEIEAPEDWDDFLERDDATRTSRAVPVRTESSASARRALSHAVPLARARGFTLAEIRISTGRTHQIRAQAAFHGHPLAGDGKYGSGRPASPNREIPYFLHALSMSFRSTIVEGLPSRVTAPPGREFVSVCDALFGLEPGSFHGIA